MNRFLSTANLVAGLLLCLLATSCDDPLSNPYPGHTWISGITVKSAKATSRIVYDSEKSEFGFCWNTNGYPTLDDFHIRADVKSSLFSANLFDLKEGTKYYIRSYAKCRGDVLYGVVRTFVTVTTSLPEVNSPSAYRISHDKVTFWGGGVNANSFDVLSRGLCWATEGTPDKDDNSMEVGNGFENFACTLEGLTPGTVYYYRAWATNAAGTRYGDTRAIRTFDGFATDYDGKVYSSVRIGDQEWLNRNLETTHFNNGDPIGTTPMSSTSIVHMENPVYQWGFLGFDNHVESNGRHYTWYAATDSRKICPVGWHVPSRDEWNELLSHLGDTLRTFYFNQNFNYDWNNRFNTLKSEGSFWPAQAGTRTPAGQFLYHSHYGSYWWSAAEVSASEAYAVYFGPSDVDLVRMTDKDKKSGFSVRCIRD